MAFEAGLIAYTGLAGLAASVAKHRRDDPALRLLPPATVRVAGSVLLGLSLLLAIAGWGSAIGIVGWVAQISVAGVAFVLLLSWRPRIAFRLSIAALLCAGVIAVA
ncbi:DUF3325 family protein [Sphingomonas hengshuiensis]|uniref:DUF3325 domain-containing protein n=1 Tax=Sphingomonas hengshuiensis TaxID=1609977 RepID=A0A7U4LFZ7_9SPHN|nr:DUF3325 family protein [Sphingomonas hengshuiensis]AJP72980.1 hypothetical protein TS85_16045 [Sphingomonas hengshuiensis]